MAAARLLSVEELGAYALVFSVAILAGTFPQQLIGVPARARLIGVEDTERASALPLTLRLALPYSMLSGVAASMVFFAVPDVDLEVRLALTAAGVLYAATAPLTEHARAMFHLSKEHALASKLSALRLVGTAIFLALGLTSNLPVSLLPLGSLALADLLVLAVSVGITRNRSTPPLKMTHRQLARSGSWLLGAAAIGPAAGFGVNALVTVLAGSAALGSAEGARILAQPVLVLAMGLKAVSGPSSMEAARTENRRKARELRGSFNLALVIGALLMASSMLLPDTLNPALWLVPVAFEIPGLVFMSVAAALVNGIVFLTRDELIAANRTRSVGAAEAVASAARLVAGLPAASLTAWTVPVSFFVGGVARIALLKRQADRIYLLDERDTS